MKKIKKNPFIIRNILGLSLVFSCAFCALVADPCDSPFPSSDLRIKSQKDRSHKRYVQRIEVFKTDPISEGGIVFIGDSLTQRGGDWSASLGVPGVHNRGILGDTTEGVLARLNEIICARPSKVFLMIGTNDMFRDISTADICSNIINIAEKIRSGSPDTVVYIQTLFPSRGERDKIDKRILATNERLRREAKSNGFVLIDTYPVMLGEDGHLLPDLSRDNLHLNAKGYLVWVELLHKYIF